MYVNIFFILKSYNITYVMFSKILQIVETKDKNSISIMRIL